MTTPLNIADRQAICAQIAGLDLLINKLTKIFNSNSFKCASLMVSGKNSLNKEYHELIVWDSNLPLPKMRLQVFLQHYCQDLILSRANLLSLVEVAEIEFKDETRQAYCSHCSRQTAQRNFEILPGSANMAVPLNTGSWICNECESVQIPVPVHLQVNCGHKKAEI